MSVPASWAVRGSELASTMESRCLDASGARRAASTGERLGIAEAGDRRVACGAAWWPNATMAVNAPGEFAIAGDDVTRAAARAIVKG
jgi:hypothetical protein